MIGRNSTSLLQAALEIRDGNTDGTCRELNIHNTQVTKLPSSLALRDQAMPAPLKEQFRTDVGHRCKIRTEFCLSKIYRLAWVAYEYEPGSEQYSLCTPHVGQVCVCVFCIQ